MAPRKRSVTKQLLHRRAQELKRQLPKAAAGDDRGVHQARVATRRLREAVPILSSGLKNSKAGKARRKIRRLTKALGTVRELDVTVGILDELAAGAALPRNALEEVRAHVIAERDERFATMAKRLEGVNTDKLNRRLTSVAEACDAATTEQWRSVLGARILKRAKRLGSAIDDAGKMYAPEHLHEVRIAAKKLRYALELAADVRIPDARRLVGAMKNAQELLGRLHDLQILQTHVAAVQAAPSSSRNVSKASLDTIAARIEEECRRLHARYVASTPKLRDALERVRAQLVPRLAGERARRPIKMGLPRTARAAAR
jgi:CHAD domain-containing protein